MRVWQTTASLTSVCRKVMDQMFLETTTRQMADKRVIGNSQHIITKDILGLTNTTIICGEMTSSVHERIAMDVIYLEIAKALKILSRKEIGLLGCRTSGQLFKVQLAAHYL